MSQNRQNIFLRALQVAIRHSAQLTILVLAGGVAVDIATGGTVLDPALRAILINMGLGAEAFGLLLDRLSSKPDLSNEALLEELRSALNEQHFDDLLAQRQTQKTLARLFERQERLIGLIVSQADAPTLEALQGRMEQLDLIHVDLRLGFQTVLWEMKRQHEEVIDALRPSPDRSREDIIVLQHYPALKDYVYDVGETIESVTRWFVGRDFVFEKFETFLKQHPCGYFRIIADAGLGKTALATLTARVRQTSAQTSTLCPVRLPSSIESQLKRPCLLCHVCRRAKPCLCPKSAPFRRVLSS